MRNLPCFINSVKTNNRSTHKAAHALSAAGRFTLLQDLSEKPPRTKLWIFGDAFNSMCFIEPWDPTPTSTFVRYWTPCFLSLSLPFFAAPSLVCLNLPWPLLCVGPNSCNDISRGTSPPKVEPSICHVSNGNFSVVTDFWLGADGISNGTFFANDWPFEMSRSLNSTPAFSREACARAKVPMIGVTTPKLAMFYQFCGDKQSINAQNHSRIKCRWPPHPSSRSFGKAYANQPMDSWRHFYFLVLQ